MTPTLEGRIQTRLFLAATIGVLWTALIVPFLPRPGGVTDGMWTWGMRYSMAFISLLLMAIYGLVWEHLYHRLQQRRWDRDWPTLFGLLTIINEAPVVWLMGILFFPIMAGPTPEMLTVHDGGIAGPHPGMSDPIPDMVGYLDTSDSLTFGSPYFIPYLIHVVTTWVVMWLFSQGPMRAIFIRWRFEGGRVVHSRIPETPVPDSSLADSLPPPGGRPELDQTRPDEDPTPANGAPASPNGDPASSNADGELVEGGVCGHGHFGHPDLRYCMICGGPQPRSNGTRALGRRPPVGILIFDDGTTHVLDGDVRLAPSEGPTRAEGPAQAEGPDTLTTGRFDEVDAASALAEIRLAGWQPAVSSDLHPIDLALPDGEQLRVVPGESARLSPGAEFTIATHRIRYESPYHSADPDPDPAAHDPRTTAMPEDDAAAPMTAAASERPGAPRVRHTLRG